ncbi:cation-transporting P-type ATPase [Pyxidicoccus sp. MSG2]|uniref:cation-transporting P-type ATPase n=1 Tax=Pyxidicoccus sp. MSG2 TaxID=2996790 RepID=UPI00226E78C9|nr:cation-transporting P-type ATPase [Pyxidicoccus sp. MSG2]MCY1022351.1 cation-transporting P-type ATPase [Pyxidicoccus sp. MSG2]
MKIQHLTVDESLRSLDSRAGGLATAEAERRLRELGPNPVSHAEQESLARRLLRQFTHFFALVPWAAAADAAQPQRGADGRGRGARGRREGGAALPVAPCSGGLHPGAGVR